MAERCYSTTCHPIGKETLKASQKVTTAGQCGHKTASGRVAVVRECRGKARNCSWKGLLASDRARAAELLEENICTPLRNGKECRTGKQVEEMGSHNPHSAEFLLAFSTLVLSLGSKSISAANCKVFAHTLPA